MRWRMATAWPPYVAKSYEVITAARAYSNAKPGFLARMFRYTPSASGPVMGPSAHHGEMRHFWGNAFSVRILSQRLRRLTVANVCMPRQHRQPSNGCYSIFGGQSAEIDVNGIPNYMYLSLGRSDR